MARFVGLERFFSLASTFMVLVLASATLTPAVQAQGHQLHFDQLSVDQGLAQVSGQAVVQDSKGFIWVGTQEGLHRYDGYEVVNHKQDPHNPESLAGNNVTGLYLDRSNQLWIFSQPGLLTRLDLETERFRRFVPDSGNPNSLSPGDLNPSAFHQDAAGRLWVAIRDAGIDIIADDGSIVHLRPDPDDPRSLPASPGAQGLPSANITTFLEDSTGVLWIGTFDSGLARSVPSDDRVPPADRVPPDDRVPPAHRFITYRHVPDDPTSLGDGPVTALFEDRQGRLLIGTGGSGLYQFERDSESFRRLPSPAEATDSAAPVNTIAFSPTPHLPSIAEDQAGNLWAITGSGLLKWGPKRQPARHYQNRAGDIDSLANNLVNGILADRAGDVWVATQQGLSRFDPRRDSFTSYHPEPADPNSLAGNIVLTLLEDHSGILWIGTSTGGVSRLSGDKHQFKHHRRPSTAPPGEGDNMVYNVLLTRDGTLWCATLESGVYRFDKARQNVVERYYATPDGQRNIGSNFTRLVHEDAAGRIWIATQGAGLARVDPQKGVVVRRFLNDPNDPASLASNQVFGIDEDSQGLLWISTIGGWHRLDPESGEIKRYSSNATDPRGLVVPFVRLTYEDRSGNLWVAGVGGFGRFDHESESFTNYLPNPNDPDGLVGGNIMALHDDGQGHLYVATYGHGLERLDLATGKFSQFGIREGLPGASLYSVLPDQQGDLWISTNHGLSRFNPAAETFTNFDRGDGLQSNEFNGRSYFKAANGEMFFGGTDGITSFFPQDIQPRTFKPPVVLTAFKKFDQVERSALVLDEMESLTLSYKDRFFGFEFAALDYHNPGKNRYAYKLEGFDEEWIQSGSRRYATYTNLDGATYTFKVRGTNGAGVWSDDEASIRVVVVPPLWKTWSAIALYVLALALALFGYLRFKTRRHQEEMRHQREELQRQRLVSERLQQIDTMKDEFLANTSHELRTPLNGIIGIAESLLDGATGELSKPTRSNLFMVASSGRRLAHLVDDILDFSKLKNREIELRKRSVSLRELVEIVLTLSRPLAAGRGLELANHVAADAPRVLADENRLQQVLHNLVGNAIKFTEQGSVSVESEARDGLLFTTVADTGIGMPTAALKRIFRSFEQADASSAREYGGTGLGLTISRQLIELHGGEISAQSEVGQGSRFTFSLPLADAEEMGEDASKELTRIRDRMSSPPSGGAPSDDRSPNGNGHKITSAEAIETGEAAELEILIVDDELINLQVMRNILTLQHYGVTEALDGPRALELLEGGYAPDLVLLDVMMPRMTGFEVARRMRQEHSANDLPIILVTAKNQVSDLMEGLASGANDYITKPFSKDELLARIHTHVSLSKAHSEAAENQRKTKELEQARSIQLSMLPASPPDVAFLDIAVHLQTATEVGGDYYDFFPQADGALYVATGDATGHGISAGMMVSMTKSALKALDVQSPHILLTQLNQVFRGVQLQRMKMALNVAYITETEVALASAAMPPVFLYRAETDEVTEILVSGLPLGSLPNLTYRLEVFDFRPGDIMLMISDGLPETLNSGDEQLGYQAVERLLTERVSQSAEEIMQALVELGEEWSGPGRELDDDVTVIVLKRR